MSFYHEGVKVPWFAEGWRDEFVNSLPIERAVLSILKLYKVLFNQIDISQSRGLAILDISFEQLVFNPCKVLSNLEIFIERSHHRSVYSILKSQKIPRKTISEGLGHRSYGWVKGGNTEENNYRRLFELLQSFSNLKLLQEFNNLISFYNRRYPSALAQYESIN
jgi:hypothetical protein